VADECAAALRADRLDGHLGDVLGDAAHAAEADIHRWLAGGGAWCGDGSRNGQKVAYT
jgi:hypothetical protein